MVLDAQDIFPNWSWQYHALIGFICFAIIIIWIVRDRQSKIAKLIDNRPTIQVDPMKERNMCYLMVHNNGAEASFKVQIELTSDDPTVHRMPHYNGFWKYGNGPEAIINRGHDDFIKIAELYSSNPPGTISQHLKIFFHQPGYFDAGYITTSSHFLGGTITNTEGNTRPLEKHEYNLNVTISSSPELREGIFKETYILDVDGFKEISDDQSVPDN